MRSRRASSFGADHRVTARRGGEPSAESLGGGAVQVVAGAVVAPGGAGRRGGRRSPAHRGAAPGIQRQGDRAMPQRMRRELGPGRDSGVAGVCGAPVPGRPSGPAAGHDGSRTAARSAPAQASSATAASGSDNSPAATRSASRAERSPSVVCGDQCRRRSTSVTERISCATRCSGGRRGAQHVAEVAAQLCRSLAVGLVRDEHVADLEQPGLGRLNAVTHAGRELAPS